MKLQGGAATALELTAAGGITGAYQAAISVADVGTFGAAGLGATRVWVWSVANPSGVGVCARAGAPVPQWRELTRAACVVRG